MSGDGNLKNESQLSNLKITSTDIQKESIILNPDFKCDFEGGTQWHDYLVNQPQPKLNN